MSSKRLQMLEKLTSEGSKDPFHWYALALEYQSSGRLDDALKAFDKLREIDRYYVPMYLMCGQMLAKAGRTEEARAWFTEGVDVARVRADSHALGEIQTALAELG